MTKVKGEMKDKAIERIRRNGGKVDEKKRTISHRMPGIKVLGAIDCLQEYFGYTWLTVS
jgi:hypothetical protein